MTVRWTPSTHRLVLQFPLDAWVLQVRDPVQHLHSLRLLRRRTHRVSALAPNRWLVDLKDLAALELTYVIEARISPYAWPIWTRILLRSAWLLW